MTAIQCVCVVWKLLATPVSYDLGPAVQLPPNTVIVGVEKLENVARLNQSPTFTVTVKF